MPSPLQPGLSEWIPHRFGAVRQVVAVGSKPGTFIVATSERRVVAKQLDVDRTAEEVQRLHEVLERAEVLAPPLLDVIEVGRRIYALYGFLEGTSPTAACDGWNTMWEDAFALLARLREIPAPMSRAVDTHWLARGSATVAEDLQMAKLCVWLREIRRPPSRTLAHGDFAPQNFLVTPNGLALLDWEEAGGAPSGFDAGWLMALNRIGAGPRWSQEELRSRLVAMGWKEECLRYSEGLGLLRLHHRAVTWCRERPKLVPLLERVKGAIGRFLISC